MSYLDQLIVDSCSYLAVAVKLKPSYSDYETVLVDAVSSRTHWYQRKDCIYLSFESLFLNGTTSVRRPPFRKWDTPNHC